MMSSACTVWRCWACWTTAWPCAIPPGRCGTASAPRMRWCRAGPPTRWGSCIRPHGWSPITRPAMYCHWSSPAGWPSRSLTGWRVPMNETTLDKRLVAESFSRAAPTYDKAAALQRTVGSNLLGRLPRDFVPVDILDLGCGTGHFTRALAACFDTPVIGLDLAEGMLRHANEHSPGLDHWITADAERLPLRSESRDLIFSSLAMQWCPRLEQALAGAWRVLRPGGCLAFSALLEGSLEELRQSWKAVDNLVHVNSFMSLTELTILLDDA